MKRIVLCGTDTGVGKTWIGVRLVRALRAKGLSVGVFKPIESGALGPDGVLFAADAHALAEAAGVADVSIVCPWPLPRPVAPAAELVRLDRKVTASAIRQAAAVAEDGHDVLIIETAGGVLSPVTPSLTSADICTLFEATTVLVAASRLGCVSHTVTAFEALRNRDAHIGAIALNELPGLESDHALNAEWINRSLQETYLTRTVDALVEALRF